MKVLVATRETQREYGTDFCWATEGEVVTLGFMCHDEDDGRCGCRRSLVGIEGREASTTFKVVDREDVATVNDLIAVLAASDHDPRLFIDDDYECATYLARVAEDFPVGTVLEVRDQQIQPRITRRTDPS